MKYETDLRRALGLGSAKRGLGHWIAQRVTAVALLFLGLWFVGFFIVFLPAPFEVTSQLFFSPWMATLSILFIFTSFYHGYLGVQVILEDYVSHEYTKWVLILGTKFLSTVLALLATLSILKLYLS